MVRTGGCVRTAGKTTPTYNVVVRAFSSFLFVFFWFIPASDSDICRADLRSIRARLLPRALLLFSRLGTAGNTQVQMSELNVVLLNIFKPGQLVIRQSFGAHAAVIPAPARRRRTIGVGEERETRGDEKMVVAGASVVGFCSALVLRPAPSLHGNNKFYHGAPSRSVPLWMRRERFRHIFLLSI